MTPLSCEGGPGQQRVGLAVAVGVLSVALVSQILWFLFPYSTLATAGSTTLVLASAFLVWRYAKLVSLFSVFIIAYMGLYLIAYIDFAVSEEISRSSFRYLWMTSTGLSIFLVSYFFSCRPVGARERELYVLRILNMLLSNISAQAKYLLYLPLILGSAVLAVEVMRVGGFESHSRAVTKEEFSFLARVGRYLIILSLPCLFSLGMLAQRHKSFLNWAFQFAIIGACVAVIFFSLRTRSYVVAPLFSYSAGIAIGVLLRAQKPRVRRIRLSPSTIIVSVLVVSLVVSLSAFLRFYRGIIEVGKDASELNAEVILDRTTTQGDLGYGYLVSDIMETFEQENRRLNGQSYYRVLFAPVPRAIWPDKPQNTQRIIGEIMGGETDWWTLPPGIQGDAFVNFGMIGVLVFLAFGVAAGAVDRQTSITHVLFVASSFMPMLHLCRGGVTNPLSLLLVTYVSALVVGYFLRRSSVRARREYGAGVSGTGAVR